VRDSLRDAGHEDKKLLHVQQHTQTQRGETIRDANKRMDKENGKEDQRTSIICC